MFSEKEMMNIERLKNSNKRRIIITLIIHDACYLLCQDICIAVSVGRNRSERGMTSSRRHRCRYQSSWTRIHDGRNATQTRQSRVATGLSRMPRFHWMKTDLHTSTQHLSFPPFVFFIFSFFFFFCHFFVFWLNTNYHFKFFVNHRCG